MKKIISLVLILGLVLFLLAPMGYAEGEEGGEVPDEPEITGYIEVVKTVENAVSGMPDRDFQFVIRLTSPDDFISYEELGYQIDGTGDFHVQNGGIFTLKARQTARFSNIHNGRPYFIHEIPSANFEQVMSDEYTGEHDGTEKVLTFTNRYTPQDNSIKVVKTVDGENFPDRLFKFTISLSGESISSDEMRYQITDENGNVYHDEDYVYEGGEYPDYRQVGDDGVFYLKAGQTARFPFIQDGHSYVIHEIPCVDFVQVQPTTGNSYSDTFNGTETILPFTNRYKKENVLAVSKSVSNKTESTPDDGFNFVIRLTEENLAENELLYEIADIDGNIIEKNGERYFSLSSENVFSIKDGQTARFPHIQTGRHYKIYEVPSAHFHQTKPVQTDYNGVYDGNGIVLPFVNKYVSEVGIPRATFENTKKQNGLEVMKTVTNQDEFTPNIDFEFTITLSGGSGEVSDDELRYQIINIEGKVYDLSGILHSPFLEDGETVDFAYHEYRSIENGGKFYLKDGQIARFPRIMAGRNYEISESNSDRFVQIQPPADTNYSGVYDGTGVRREFINEYTPRSDPNTLTVKKRVSAPIGYEYDGDMEFAFRIKVNGEPYAYQDFVISDANEVYREEKTDEDGIFYLKADEQALFHRNEPFSYSIEEIISDAQEELGWRTVGEPSVSDTTSENNDVTFVNANASLVVQKVMMDGSNTDDSFVFHITDIYERGLQAKYYLYDINGNILDNGQLHTTSADQEDISADGEFTLKANQAAYFIGLNVGRIYNIYEEFMDGYVQRVPTTSEGYNVEIKNRAEVITFRNDRQTLKGVLKVNKHVTDIVPSETAPVDKVFTFKLLRRTQTEPREKWEAVSGESYTINEGISQITRSTDNEGRFTLHKNETAVFKHLPKPNTYKVVEETLNDSEYKDKPLGISGELTYENYLNFIYENLYKPEMTDIEITKIDEDDTSKRLAGAKFTIYTDEAMTKVLAESEASNENGKIVFQNLKAGTYYIKETKSPAYYDRNNEAVKVHIYKDDSGRLNAILSSLTSENDSPVEHKEEENENYENPYFIVKHQTDENGFFVNDRLYFRVTDSKADLLPRAGGYLLWFNLAGYIMAILGAFGIVTAFIRKYKIKREG